MQTKVIPPADYPRLYALVEEYLPGTSRDALDAMCAEFPSAVVGGYLEGALIAVCYGMANDAEDFMLDGICVEWDYMKAGRGGELLAFFEAQVRALGYTRVTLGSADGHVERFYLKHGYTPVELKVYADEGFCEELSAGYRFPVAYTQPEGARLKLVIAVTDYAAMDKEEIAAHYKGSDPFFVFTKRLG